MFIFEDKNGGSDHGVLATIMRIDATTFSSRALVVTTPVIPRPGALEAL